MKANELRRGNFVTNEFYDTFKDVIIVESINDNGINLVIADDGNWSEIAKRWIAPEITFEEIFGIPITPEWLEMVGFEKNIFSNGDYKYIKNGLSISSNLRSANWKFGRIENERCKYVHQLQNLYFALTGEELEYKPNI